MLGAVAIDFTSTEVAKKLDQLHMINNKAT